MSLSSVQKYESLSIYDPLASMNFSVMLSKYISALYKPPYKELVLLCIGTDRSTGDALGPIVGHKLINSLYKHDGVYIFGTLDDPVHAKNLKQKIDEIYSSLENPFVVAIDASLGKMSSIGLLTVGEGPVKPGAGVNKDLPHVGDIHITGIVNLGGYMEYLILQNTRLSLVMNMADILVQSIRYSLWKLNNSSSVPFK